MGAVEQISTSKLNKFKKCTQIEIKIKMRSEANWLMGKFLGIEPHTKRSIMIFTITMIAVWFPVNIVMGAIVLNDCSVQPKLPQIMVSIAVVEPFWWCLLFYLFIYIPRKEHQSGLLMLSNIYYWIAISILCILTIAVGALTILQSVYMASLTKEDIDRECLEDQVDCKNCSSVVWYGGWIGLAFKYLNILKLLLCFLCYFNPRCRGNHQEIR